MKSGLSSTCLFFATVLAFHLATETGNAATNVVAWGANDSGQSSVPTTLTNITVVAGGSTHSLALNSSGLVVGWGDKVNLHIYGETIPPSSLSNAVTIAAGAELSLALQGNGTVVGWGNQAAVPAGLTNGLAIAASISNVMALTIEGSVVSWGVVPPPPAATTNVVAIGTGNQHSLALKGDGTVVGWGDNTYSQLNIPAGLTNVVELAAGTFNSLALQANGTVVAWGNNTWGQSAVPAGLSNVVAIAAGVRHGLALEQNGSVVAWGDNTNSQLNVPAGLSNVVGIAAGDYHNLAVVGNGSPVITVQPVSQYIAGTQQASFFVMAAGLAPLSYQWRQDGVIIAGATNSVLVLTNLPTSAAGVFSVTVSNSLGTVTSANVQLPPVWRRPIILLQPQGQSVLCGDPAMFQTTAKGPAAYPLSYQWQLGGTNLPGATNRVLSLASTTGASAGNYTVVVSNVNGPVTSQAAILTVIGQPPLITSPLTAAGKQGRPFSYTITGLYNPTSFQATGLPNGLNVNTTNGLISGTPLVNGPFNVTLSTATLCASATTNLMLTITSSVPIITSPLTASGEQAAFNYQIRATESPTGFGATNLPLGLSVNPTTGVISGNAFFAGNYTATIMASNVWGIGTTNLQLSITSSVPVITSALTVSNEQAAFNYQILATESPTGFGATNLPLGLSVNPITGVISGNAFYTGNYTATITASNVWGVGTTNLQVSIVSSAPVITNALTASGTEMAAFNFQILATESPTGFGAENLPQGLSLDPATGIISGSPVYAGNYGVTISASNVWGVGTASLQLDISNASITGLAIINLRTNYSTPYLLNFQFELLDNTNPAVGNAVVANPRLFTVTAFEDTDTVTNIVSTNETSVILQGVNQGVAAKVLKAELVLDFSESIADPYGALDSNGIPVAVDTEVSAAQEVVNQQPATAQFGIYEFHRDDVAPNQVQTLTANKTLLNKDIAGIWTNYVQNPAGSRCWDALFAAIQSLGTNNADEQHAVIFCSDGYDTSSTKTFQSVITAASNANVQVYCVGFGDPIDTATLTNITSQTQGRYYEATNLADLAFDFAQIGKDLSAQYFLRWATLNRSTKAFMPSFQITYIPNGITAYSPPNQPPFISATNIASIDTNTTPATTNYTYTWTTNYVISPYLPADHAGGITNGSLRLVANADVLPSSITLRATYVPRYVRQIRLHYRANWPCIASLESTNAGEQLYGWSLTQTNDGAGGQWAMLTSSNPQSLATSIPFADFGPLLTFNFHDVLNASNAFSVFQLDNTIYTNTGNQRFVFENTNAFIKVYPVLPHGTPVPWLIQYGFTNTNNWVANETNRGGNGLLIWQDYVAGLNPTNAGSVFKVLNVSPAGWPVGNQITFTTALNRTYRVDTSTNLLTWQTLQDGIAGTGGNVTVFDNRNLSGTTHTFYRVAVYIY